jgi:hypothetical protein
MTRQSCSTASILTLAMLLLGRMAQAAIIPPIGLAAGAPYQLIFVTADSIDALSPFENQYNTFVTNEAALNPSLPTATWHAITSTVDSTDASTNAPWLSLPVYNTLGQLVTSAAQSLYTPTHLAPITGDQYGGPIPPGPVWTGSSASGTGNFRLGLPNQYGDIGSPLDPGFWLRAGQAPFILQVNQLDFPIYALSGVIHIPTPEPSSFILLIAGIAGLAGAHWRQRRKRCSRGD